MSIRPNIRSNRLQTSTCSPRASLKNFDNPKQSTRSNTPSTSRTRSFEPQPRQPMESPTPTPRRVRPKRNRPKQQEQRESEAVDNDSANIRSEPSSEDELFDLLGITPAVQEATVSAAAAPAPDSTARGLLALSKEDIAESKEGRRSKKNHGPDGPVGDVIQDDRATPQRKGTKKGHAVEKGFDTGASDGRLLPLKSVEKAARTRSKRTTASKDGSKPSGTAHNHHGAMPRQAQGGSNMIPGVVGREIGTPSFDMSTLSQSLPSQHGDFMENAVKQHHGKGRDQIAPAGWDMPEIKGTQALTWQQQEMQQALSREPRKSSRAPLDRKAKKAPSAFQPSALNPSRPAHTRRASTDGLPLPAPPRSAPPGGSSVFDHHVPYHIGFNVNRAPQTPSKTGLRTTLQNTPLPLIKGDFPRINKVFDNVLGQQSYSQSQTAPNLAPGSGIKYAGPTSHNSPHAASLAKPDLDDF